MNHPIPILNRILVVQDTSDELDEDGKNKHGLYLPLSYQAEDLPTGIVVAVGSLVKEIEVGDHIRWKKHPGMPATYGCEEIEIKIPKEDNPKEIETTRYLVMVDSQVMVVLERARWSKEALKAQMLEVSNPN